MVEEGWSIKVRGLADPVKFSNKPRLTHSTAKGGTNFSFDIVGKALLPWRQTERAKVEVSFSGEEIFVGNILSRSTDWSNLTTNYNALGYYTHTRRNPIIGKFKNLFSIIINQLLDESGARPFINNISYRIGNIADSETSILSVFLDRQYSGQYLDACLDDLCKAVGCQWFIKPESGSLVLWQSNQIAARGEIDIEAERQGQCQTFKHNSIRPNFIYPEINRVVVAKDSESLLNRYVPQMDSINNYSILPNSPTNQVDLLKKTNIVKKYFITPNQAPCNLTINPLSSSFPKEGGRGSFDVMDRDECRWMATSQASWVSLTGNTNGYGNGVVAFSVAPNPSTAARSSSILVRTDDSQATHFIGQAGSGVTPCQACQHVYFTLTGGNPVKVILNNTPEIPKTTYADIQITPYPLVDPPADATSGTYSEDYELVLDLTDSSLDELTLLTLDYDALASGGSEGFFDERFPFYPAGSYSAKATITIIGGGISEVIEASVFYEGGGFNNEFGGFYIKSELKTSFGGNAPAIDLLGARGSVINISVHLEGTLNEPPNGYYESTNLAFVGASATFALLITCKC